MQRNQGAKPQYWWKCLSVLWKALWKHISWTRLTCTGCHLYLLGLLCKLICFCKNHNSGDPSIGKFKHLWSFADKPFCLATDWACGPTGIKVHCAICYDLHLYFIGDLLQALEDDTPHLVLIGRKIHSVYFSFWRNRTFRLLVFLSYSWHLPITMLVGEEDFPISNKVELVIWIQFISSFLHMFWSSF